MDWRGSPDINESKHGLVRSTLELFVIQNFPKILEYHTIKNTLNRVMFGPIFIGKTSPNR